MKSYPVNKALKDLIRNAVGKNFLAVFLGIKTRVAGFFLGGGCLFFFFFLGIKTRVHRAA